MAPEQGNTGAWLEHIDVSGAWSERLGQFDLTGKVALVTGAAQGIGRAICLGFADSGATVACLDLNAAGATEVAEIIQQRGGHALALPADVTDDRQLARAVQQTISSFDKIDILVTCARITQRIAATEFPREIWRAILEVNLLGVFLACQAVGREMVRRRSGSIINLASIAALGGLGRGNTAYSASKGGVVALTRELAIEWAPSNVRVNALAPCQVRTPVVEPLLADPQLARELVWRIPAGRIATVDDIVGPAIFLASDASRMITGHVLVVDGGYSAQ
jgi:NAD(P)-dependent dehydrogenase (short-subunit alcohol dehydrogenase family)